MTANDAPLITYKKPWYQSRMLWFNAIVALLIALEAGFSLLQPYMQPMMYAYILLAVTLINAVLRVITTQGLRS